MTNEIDNIIYPFHGHVYDPFTCNGILFIAGPEFKMSVGEVFWVKFRSYPQWPCLVRTANQKQHMKPTSVTFLIRLGLTTHFLVSTGDIFAFNYIVPVQPVPCNTR